MSNITKQLKELQDIKPNADWKNSQRDILLSQIKQQTTPQKSSVFANGWFMMKSAVPAGVIGFVARPIGVLTVIGLFVFSTGILGVNASKGSLPGDFLYPVKITTEKVQVGLTISDDKKAELHVSFAENRVNEIDEIIQSDLSQEDKNEKIVLAVDGLKNDMENAQDTMIKVSDNANNSKETINIIKEIDEKSDALGDKIELQKVGFEDNFEMVSDLTEAVDVTIETSVQAIEVIILEREKGEIEMTDQELFDVLERKINKAEIKVKESIDLADGEIAQRKVPAVEVLVEEEESTEENADSDESQESKKTIKQESNSEDKVNEELTEAETNNIIIDVRPGEAEKSINEAKDLLDQGDLLSAIEKIKESSLMVKEVNETVERVNVVVDSFDSDDSAPFDEAQGSEQDLRVVEEGEMEDVEAVEVQIGE
jgi:hypothetical protein